MSHRRKFEFVATFVKCEERFQAVSTKMVDKVAITEKVSIGWYVTFDNHMSVCVGIEDPKILPNAICNITIEAPVHD